MKKKPKAKSYQDRCNEYMEKDSSTLSSLNLRKTLLIGFKGKSKVPFLSSIAILIIRIQGGEVHTRIDDVTPQK